MIASPHLLQMRLVRWLSSSRFASEARAVFESSPFLGIDTRPLSPIFLLDCCFLYLDFPEVLMYLAMGYTIHGASITSATVYHMVGEVSMLVPQYFRGLATGHSPNGKTFLLLED